MVNSKRPIKVRKFRHKSSEPKEAVRGLQIWQILIGLAHEKRTITYGQLAKLMGYKGSGVIFDMLGHVSCFCSQHSLPILTVIVVNKATEEAGDGLSSVGSHRKRIAERRRVFKYKWYLVYPPSVADLATAFKDGMLSKKKSHKKPH